MLWMNCSALDSSLWIAGTALARYSMDGVKSDVVGMADTSHMNVYAERVRDWGFLP